MENASKALLIAGAILICILLVAVGMYIFNGSNSSIESSIATMSTQEIETFNTKYTMYEGEQSGANVKALLGTLISNSNTNKGEITKIPGVYFENYKNNKEKIDSSLPIDGENAEYLDVLQNIKHNIDNKHKYWVEFNFQNNGLIDYVNISYDKNHIIEPMSRN